MSKRKYQLPEASDIDAIIAAASMRPETAEAAAGCAGADADADSGRPPRLIGGERKNNPEAQGTEAEGWETFKTFTHVISSNGKLLEVPLRRGQSDAAFIDQLTFTIHESTLCLIAGHPLVADEEYLIQYSRTLQEIFGFGITKKFDYRGKFFYNECYQLGPEDMQYGKLHYGGQRETVLVELNAQGCIAAKEGWEKRLYDFLADSVRPKITRVDVAHDFFQGEYTPEQALVDLDNGGFSWTNRIPKSECRGSDWRSQDGSGRTFYIGSRESSKLTRVYEKGKQLGDKESPWVRFEVEFRARDIVIPLDVLLRPGKYLSGAYPICESIFRQKSERIEAVKKTVNLMLEHKVRHARNQVGRLLNFLSDLGYDAEDIVNQLKPEHDKYPKGLRPEEYDCQVAADGYMHAMPRHKVDEFGMVEIDYLTRMQEDPNFDRKERMFPDEWKIFK
jgi:putative uncharacterized protein (fragment)